MASRCTAALALVPCSGGPRWQHGRVIIRGRSAVLVGMLLTVGGACLMVIGLLLDSSVFVQLTHSLVQPAQIVRRNSIIFSDFFTMATVRGAPGKKEVGNAGWTLIHSIAANYPETPSSNDQHHAKNFLRSIAKLYPCKRCRQHFDKYIAANPPDLSSREKFMLWTCGAHNDVNRRQGKAEVQCSMKYMEHRWGDCGCKLKKRATRASASAA